jgi:putative transposase
MREAFPWDHTPKYLLRDRDAIYGNEFAAMTQDMEMEEILTAPRSPWQNPYVERLVSSIRRECLDHVIGWNQKSLRRTLWNYFVKHDDRTHLGLSKETPGRRPRSTPTGRVISHTGLGGLHHRYDYAA